MRPGWRRVQVADLKAVKKGIENDLKTSNDEREKTRLNSELRAVRSQLYVSTGLAKVRKRNTQKCFWALFGG